MAANGGANGRAGSGDQPMGEADEYEDILGSQLQYRAALPNALRPLGHSKSFRDTIHGLIDLGPLTVAMVDTPHFQRLRSLKQLGVSNFVWPGAVHTRFEHSIGVAHLAGSVAWTLVQQQPGEDVRKSDVALVEAAGLCHDLGHGPFSHSFERFIRAVKPQGQAWHHEEMSVWLLEDMINEHPKVGDHLNDNQIQKLYDLIKAGDHKGPSKGWLYDIVANGRNGLDVDKFDYLQRDSYHTGVRVATDFSRLVIGDEICFRWKEYKNVFQVYSDRTKMHQDVYNHRAARGIEYMVIDCLKAADGTLKLSEDIWDAKQYLYFNDSILETIRTWGRWHKGSAPHNDSDIAEAQAILRRLDCRDIYKFCNESCIPDLQRYAAAGKPTPAAIANNVIGCHIDEADIIVDEISIGMAAGDRNPLDNTHFFQHSDSTEKISLRQDQVSRMLPQYYQEKYLRIYSRKNNEETIGALHGAMDRWMQDTFGSDFVPATPKPRKISGDPSQPARTDVGNKRARKQLEYGAVP